MATDLNLETLKQEMLDYLGASDFAVFRAWPGSFDAMEVVGWDSEACPDYRMFLDTARKAGEKLITFSARLFEDAEAEAALEDLEAVEITREEHIGYERRIRAARRHVGQLCSLELSFVHGTRIYTYELMTAWYEEFLDLCDEIASCLPEAAPGGHDGSLGGYYSAN